MSSKYNEVLGNCGGALKLKGKALKDVSKKKKKKSKKQLEAIAGEAVSVNLDKLADQERESDRKDEELQFKKDVRTDAEKRYDAVIRKRMRDQASKEASTSYRQRIEKLNESLANLSEHHDIPRISGMA
eukprot:Rmarinus@m.29906